MIGALVIVFVFSVIHVVYPPVAGGDKIKHFLTYFLLCFLFYWNGFSLTSSLLLSISYGAFLEIVQYFIPYRECSLFDILANAGGAGLFCLLSLHKKLIKRYGVRNSL